MSGSRGILDGHVILSRKLGAAGHYPAIDVLNSISRLASRVASKEQQASALKLRQAMALYQQSEDLIKLGAYAGGTNSRLDAAIQLQEPLAKFLQQAAHEPSPLDMTLEGLRELSARVP